MHHREGLPYSLFIASSIGSGTAHHTVEVSLTDGYWSDCPRLLRLRLQSFYMTYHGSWENIVDRDGIFVCTNLRSRNYITSTGLAPGLTVVAHIANDITSSDSPIVHKGDAIDVIVERPMDGQSIVFEQRSSSDPANLVHEPVEWSAAINLYPILESDQRY
jgi:hypothetical protein